MKRKVLTGACSILFATLCGLVVLWIGGRAGAAVIAAFIVGALFDELAWP